LIVKGRRQCKAITVKVIKILGVGQSEVPLGIADQTSRLHSKTDDIYPQET
jgi:hypothetical protein